MSSTAQPPGRRKLVHHLDTPFSTISWPEVSLNDQDTILELLCNLLSPLGHHRRAHVKRSKGKRAARRSSKLSLDDASLPNPPAPPRPELCAKVDVGFNSIARRLEELSQRGPSEGSPVQPYSMVFVARGNQSSAFNCHFPKMIGAASKDYPETDKTRLIGFSKPCSERLSSVLGVARVSSVAVVRDAPGAGALWDYVQSTVTPVIIPWLQGTGGTEYRAAKISSVETSVGAKKVKTA